MKVSLGLLPSGPDPVGEEHVRANLPERYMRIKWGERKTPAPRGMGLDETRTIDLVFACQYPQGTQMSTSSTRSQIIEKADTLFYQGGFDATSFADIAAGVGISRGNFYHHFKTKDEILDAVIDRRMVVAAATLENWRVESDDPRDRIASFIHIVIVNQTDIMAFGCPVGTLCSELAKLDHVAKRRAADILALYRDWLTTQFRMLGHGGRAEEMALHVLGWSQGVAVLATAFNDEALIRREVDGIMAWLDALPRLSNHN